MSDAKVPLVITIKKTDGSEIVYAIEKKSLTVGSGANSDLKIEGEGISVTHAVFEMRDDGLFITDLATPTGTFVNGEKITKTKLVKGDTIRIGQVMLEMHEEGDVAIPAKSEETMEPDAPVSDTPDQSAAEITSVTEEAKEVNAAVQADTSDDHGASHKKKDKKGHKKDKDGAAEDDVLGIASIGVDLDKGKLLKAKQAQRGRRRFNFHIAPGADKQDKVEGKVTLEVREISWNNTLMKALQYENAIALKVGEGIDNHFFLPSELIPSDPFTVCQFDGQSAELSFSDKEDGILIDRAGDKPLKEAAKKSGNTYSLRITPGKAAHVHFGDMSYYFRFINKEKVEPMPLSQRLNYGEVAVWVVAFVIWSLAMYQVLIMPEPEGADILEGPDRTPEAMVDAQEEEEEEPEEQALVDNGKPPEQALGEEGKIGDEKSILDKAQGTERRALAEEIANDSGLLGALDDGSEGRDKFFDGAIDDAVADNLGMLEGPEGLDQRGAGGLGARGSGFGGGGNALGIGGLGTRGRGMGGAGGRYGIGAAGNLKRQGGRANVKGHGASVQGSLDRSIIQQIINKHLNQIRHCYQKELNKNPNLYGKIVVKFTIGGAGQVLQATVPTTTMRNVEVEDCIARVIKHILFPKPKGGGIVVVSYPFVFKPI